MSAGYRSKIYRFLCLFIPIVTHLGARSAPVSDGKNKIRLPQGLILLNLNVVRLPNHEGKMLVKPTSHVIAPKTGEMSGASGHYDKRFSDLAELYADTAAFDVLLQFLWSLHRRTERDLDRKLSLNKTHDKSASRGL